MYKITYTPCVRINNTIFQIFVRRYSSWSVVSKSNSDQTASAKIYEKVGKTLVSDS